MNNLQKRIESLTYYGTGDEGYELFRQTCFYCYKLTGLGFDEEAELVCQWAEKMAKDSKEWADEEGGVDSMGKAKWGYE